MVFAWPSVIALDIPLTVLRGVAGALMGVALLRVGPSANPLSALVGCICFVNGVLVLLGILGLAFDDLSSIAFVALGYILLAQEA